MIEDINNRIDVINKGLEVLNKERGINAPKLGYLDNPKDVTPDTGNDRGGSGFNFDYDGVVGDDVINSLLTEAGETAKTPIDEDEIRKKTLRLFQKEIDATNDIYDDLVNRQRVVNKDNEGGLRAIQNRQGLIGSQRGFRQTQDQRDLGQQAIGGIQAERATRISEIMGLARSEALDEIKAKREAQQAGASAYLTYVELQDERRSNRLSKVISALVQQGIDPNEMSSQELSEIAKNLGVSTNDILIGYVDATVEDPVEEDAFNLSQGQARYVRQEDGTYVRVAFNPKTYAPKDTDGNTPVPTDTATSDFVKWAKGIQNDTQISGAMQKKQQELGRALTGTESWEVMKEAYKSATGKTAPNKSAQEFSDLVYGDAIAGLEINSLDNLTTTNKRDLQQAGLEGAEAVAQMYFLNTDSSFRDFYSRGVATGEFPANASLQEIDEAYENWFNEKEADDELSTAELLQQLKESQ